VCSKIGPLPCYRLSGRAAQLPHTVVVTTTARMRTMMITILPEVLKMVLTGRSSYIAETQGLGR
jgi:hypothetical protein